MDIQRLKGFYYTVRLGSLTKAAEKMSITQSAISQQIKSLEHEFNFKLFQRVGPRKDLTPDGELFFDLIAPLIQELDHLMINFEDLKGKQRGRVTIAVSTVMIMNFLPAIIKQYTAKYPHVRVVMLERSWNEIVSLAQAGEIDFGIAPLVKIPCNLDCIKLDPVDKMLITAKNHPLSKKEKVTLLDIAQYPLITYEKGLVARDEIDRVFNQVHLDVEVIMEATNAETIKRYVEMGVGVAIIPQIALMPALKRPLEIIPVSQYFGKSYYGVVLKQGKHITSWAKNYLNLLKPNWEKTLRKECE